MIVAALVLPETTVGITEASTTRSPSMPMHAQFRIDHGHRIDAHLAGAGGMKHGAAVVAGVFQQLRVGRHRRTGQKFLGDEGLHV